VLIPAEEVGHHAVTLLMGKLADTPVAGPESTLLPPRLTIRASTATAPAAAPASAQVG